MRITQGDPALSVPLTGHSPSVLPSAGIAPPDMRLVRIALFAAALPLLFSLSQAIAEARGQSPLPGTSLALGALSLLFLVRAAVTEWSRGPEANLQKDLLWGVAAGGLATILLRFLLQPAATGTPSVFF